MKAFFLIAFLLACANFEQTIAGIEEQKSQENVVFLVVTQCLDELNIDCQVYVPDTWQGENLKKELTACENYAVKEYGIRTDIQWQCTTQDAPVMADYQDDEGWMTE
jgi:hypothetical protein